MKIKQLNQIFDFLKISQINVRGRGGKEQEILKSLTNWERKSSSLFDYSYNQYRLEIKKQSNTQWFDIGKYYNLSEEDKKIIMMFLNHKNGIIDEIYLIYLGQFVEWMCKKYQEYGWNDEVMKTASNFKGKYPTLQFKVKADIRKVFSGMPENLYFKYKKKEIDEN